MYKSQEKAFKRMLKSLEDIQIAVEDFNKESAKKQKSQNTSHSDLTMYEDYERLSGIAYENINTAKTQIEAILDY